jgi:pyrroline-5-carboxylate reductase
MGKTLESNNQNNIAIIGAGNLGQAIALGLVKSGSFSAALPL